MTNLNPLYFIGLIVVLGLLPFFLMMVTSYVKIVVVVTLVRNALGVQQVPPAMVINGLAIIMTMFIMAPVAYDTLKIARELPLAEQPQVTEVAGYLGRMSPPLGVFLQKNTDEMVLRSLMNTARRIWPADFHGFVKESNFLLLIPSFVISELTKAFKIGFLLYLPFVVIDLIISNILLAMGMMMVSPMTISLPFKLLLFVTIDGWLKITNGLLYSYG